MKKIRMKYNVLLLLLSLTLFVFAGCTSGNPSYEKRSLIDENFAVLKDGTMISQWQDEYYYDYVYCIGDTAILVESYIPDYENMHIRIQGADGENAGQEVELSSEEEQILCDTFRSIEVMYDINAEIESAYSEYKSTFFKRNYEPSCVSQETKPTYFSDEYFYFFTETFGVDGGDFKSIVIDRKSGEQCDIWELVASSKEEGISVIFSINPEINTAQKAFLKDNIESCSVFLKGGCLYITYSQGERSGTYIYIGEDGSEVEIPVETEGMMISFEAIPNFPKLTEVQSWGGSYEVRN